MNLTTQSANVGVLLKLMNGYLLVGITKDFIQNHDLLMPIGLSLPINLLSGA